MPKPAAASPITPWLILDCRSTPQNTPANTAPISSHAQQPGIASIKEGEVNPAYTPPVLLRPLTHLAEDFDRATAASIVAQNPKLLQMIQGRLSTIVGRSSGYIESLPPQVRRRVAGLKGIQKDHSKLEAEFQEEVLQLEKKYFAKFTPLYEKRSTIVNGKAEPTEEEIKAGEEDDEEEDAATDDKAEKPTDAASAENVAGIPEFWLSAMKNYDALAETITDRDEGALKHLIDVRMEYLDKPGFRLIFEFAENDYFTNKTITKTYYYQTESGYGGEFIYDHAEGDKINWKDNQNLTVKVESKKQRNKSKNTSDETSASSAEHAWANTRQTPSKHESSRRRFRPLPSSTSSPRLRLRPTTTTTMRHPISRDFWSSTTSLARISRRRSSPGLLTGSLARLWPSSLSMTTRMTSRALSTTTRMTMTTTARTVMTTRSLTRV
jgi:nucleosome assembly protein 1-like 1